MGKRYTPEEYTVNGVDLSPHMMELTGSDYLKVAGRVLLFRRSHPKGAIETDVLQLDNEIGFAMFRAVVKDGEGNVLGADCGSETRGGFPKGYIEKASTVAIGRALALAGFGTQFATADYVDEEGKLADAPVPARQATASGPEPNALASRAQIERAGRAAERAGWTAEDGKAYLSEHFKKTSRLELTSSEIERFIKHLEAQPGADQVAAAASANVGR